MLDAMLCSYNSPVATTFQFEHSASFTPENAAEILRQIPALPGVFALCGPNTDGQATAQPYLTRAADLRRRITRMLAPPEVSADGSPVQSKRLNLRGRVARIEYTVTGSEFESTLTLYHASAAIYGLAEARRRLRLHTPFFLRFTAENPYPRVYSTNRLSRRALANTYGPFPSRAAADRYCDAVLDLFKLRRCYEDLAPHPEHPGCVYQEMKKCLAPCNQACTPEGATAYAAEAAAVEAFFDTHGESLLAQLTTERDQASADLDFERAAQLHSQFQRVKAAAALADDLVVPIPRLRAIIVQKAAQSSAEATSLLSSRSEAEGSASPSLAQEAQPAASVFLIEAGCIIGPQRLSTLGVRAVKEQTSVGSSLFAQPLMLQAVPLNEPDATGTQSVPLSSADGTAMLSSDQLSPSNASLSSSSTAPLLSSRSGAEGSASLTPTETTAGSSTPSPALNPEDRAACVLNELTANAKTLLKSSADLATLSDHLSLLRRWYYRPEKQRIGEIFFPKQGSAAPETDSLTQKISDSLPNASTVWPIRRILRGAARMALGDLQPDQAQTDPSQTSTTPKPTKMKILHKGRPGIERAVPVLDESTPTPDRPIAKPL